MIRFTKKDLKIFRDDYGAYSVEHIDGEIVVTGKDGLVVLYAEECAREVIDRIVAEKEDGR